MQAISNFPRPTNISELRRFLGMVNHVEKCAPSEKAAEFNTSACTLQSRQANQSISRCIVIWIRWRTTPEARKWLEASIVCLKISQQRNKGMRKWKKKPWRWLGTVKNVKTTCLDCQNSQLRQTANHCWHCWKPSCWMNWLQGFRGSACAWCDFPTTSYTLQGKKLDDCRHFVKGSWECTCWSGT